MLSLKTGTRIGSQQEPARQGEEAKHEHYSEKKSIKVVELNRQEEVPTP